MPSNGFSKLNLKNKIIFNISLALIIAGGIIYFAALPAVGDIEKMSGEIKAQKIDLEEKFSKGQSLAELSKNINKIEQELANLDKIFVKKDDSLKFITDLENLAEKNGVSQNINLTPKGDEKGYQTVPIKLTTTGNFHDQINYLSSLEAMNYYINISSMKITTGGRSKKASVPGSGNENPSPVVTMSITANTYWK